MLTVRKVEPGDRELLIAAAKADPFHAAVGLTGDHWVSDDALFYSDDQGPVVALRKTNVARLDIQFLTQDRKRNAHALIEGFWAYIALLQKRGIEEVIFNSNSAGVINFFEKRFQFRHIGGNTYSLRIK